MMAMTRCRFRLLLLIVLCIYPTTSGFIRSYRICGGVVQSEGGAYNTDVAYFHQEVRWRALRSLSESSDPHQSTGPQRRRKRSTEKSSLSTKRHHVISKKPNLLLSSSSSDAPAATAGASNNRIQTWRVYGVEVHPDDASAADEDGHRSDNYGRDTATVPVQQQYLDRAVLNALWGRLRLPATPPITMATISKGSPVFPSPVLNVRVVRRSVDARMKKRPDGRVGPRFVYVLDVDIGISPSGGVGKFRHEQGRLELVSSEKHSDEKESVGSIQANQDARKGVVIVGAGPAGLFCALQLARAGLKPIVLERGQPVENRGRDIGALIHRRSMDSESNFAFGEGGAGTWSDGKLTTRIGRNSDSVRHVLKTFVQYGAPETILIEGAPHLGTDNLVRLLRNMRLDLRRLGGEISFGTKVTDLIMEHGTVQGVVFEAKPAIERNADVVASSTRSEHGRIMADAVVLATGHSARDIYETLYKNGVQLEAKGFAVGYRVEHPQALINKIQYGTEWGPSVVTGKTTTDKSNEIYFASVGSMSSGRHHGRLPVPSYRLATDQAYDGSHYRGVYSFCMCPGGQIVLASTDPNEICVNGMSFSRRDSIWSNSALVVTVAPDDDILAPYRAEHGVLACLAFQRDMERLAARMGGGNLTVPVQRLTDFMSGRPSTSCPPSSYRLGVKPAACHEIYPRPLIDALRHALADHFEHRMPGFLCEDGLLHAVETRTSSPVRIPRDETTLEAVGSQRLFPAGEGAGYAGGIVSAAVDGMAVAEAVILSLLGNNGSDQALFKEATKSLGTFY